MAIAHPIAVAVARQTAFPWGEPSDETWLPVVGWDGYDVSDAGRIRSWKVGSGRQLPLLLPGYLSRKGHLQVRLSAGRKNYRVAYIHRLVLEAFVGPCPAGMVCRHLNGIPGDNRLENLAWGTLEENAADAHRHGTLKPRVPRKSRDPIMFADNFLPAESVFLWEEWRPIDKLVGYDISSFGRVRSWRLPGRWGIKFRKNPKILKLRINPRCGRPVATLMSPTGKGTWRLYVCRLVIEAFSPQPSPGLVCRHIDGNPTNNHISNLRWGTVKENSWDMALHGTVRNGERHHKAKLTEPQVMEIRRRRDAGEKRPALASEFGVTPATIYGIEVGRIWGHLPLVTN